MTVEGVYWEAAEKRERESKGEREREWLSLTPVEQRCDFLFEFGVQAVDHLLRDVVQRHFLDSNRRTDLSMKELMSVNISPH